VEFAFGLDPTNVDASPITSFTTPDQPGQLRVEYSPLADLGRYVRVQPQWSVDRIVWRNLPALRVTSNAGVVSATFLATEGPFHRLKISTIPPSGSTVSVFTTAPID
jgi:hypothetical protein